MSERSMEGALSALPLLVAESRPTNKDLLIRPIVNLITARPIKNTRQPKTIASAQSQP